MEALQRSFFKNFGNLEENVAVGGFLAVNRIAGLKKIKQTVFFDFCRVGLGNQIHKFDETLFPGR
jgi:hypothetical protein